MMIYLISTAIAIAVLFLGEYFLPNETKETYIEKGYEWNKVLVFSNSVAIIAGVFSSAILVYKGTPQELNPFFLPFATTVTAYITAQSLMTDLKVLLINRYILRVAYLAMYVISIYNIRTNDLFAGNAKALVIFTLVLFFIFMFIPIGASDVRSLAVAMPYTLSIGGYLGIELLIVTLLLTALGMWIHRRKKANKELESYRERNLEMYEEMGEKEFNKLAHKVIKFQFDNDEEHAVPVGPFMIIPFLLFFLIYPFII